MLILASNYRAEVYFEVEIDWVKALEISFIALFSVSFFFRDGFKNSKSKYRLEFKTKDEFFFRNHASG